jgi:thiol-activated cytolysin
MKKNLILIVAPTLFSLLIIYINTAYSRGSVDVAGSFQSNPRKIRNYISTIPLPTEPPSQPIDPVVTNEKDAEVEFPDGQNYACTTKDYILGQNFTEIAGFNPTEDVVWPGALVQGRSISSGIPSRINLRHAPMKITISPSEPGDNSIRVSNPSYNTVSAAVQELTKKLPKVTPAAIGYEYAEMHTAEQALLKIGVAASWVGGNARGQLSKSGSKEDKSILVKFVQRYYTVTAEPVEQGRWFGSGVSVNDLKRFSSAAEGSTGVTNPPAIVSSVTYGRMYVFKLTAKKTFDELKAAAAVSHRFVSGNVDANAEQQIREQFSSIQVQFLALGADSEEAVEAIATNDFFKLLKSGATGGGENSPGEPISYSIRYLKNDDVAKVGFTTDYSITECIPLSLKVKVTFSNFRILEDCDSGWDGKGDFVWWFGANGERIVDNGSERNLGGGEEIGIGASREFILPKKRGAQIIVQGEIKDNDGASGPDIMGPFTHIYTYGQNWDMGNKDFELRHDDGCKAQVRYAVEVVP